MLLIMLVSKMYRLASVKYWLRVRLHETRSELSQTALKCHSVYMAIYMEISLRQLFKQWQGSIAHVQMISFN